MKVLIACEESATVREEFAKRAHDAWSCDILPSRIPGKHIQGDVLKILNEGWDLMIAFPPCTHIAVSGAKHFEQKRKDGRQQKAIDFFLALTKAPVEKWAIENPVGIMSKLWRKPDQIVQPYYFGDEFQKTTCLWLKNLPRLMHDSQDNLFFPATHVRKGDFVVTPSGKRLPKWYSDNTNPRNRSKTFPGIARAMAEQWG